MKKHLSLLIEHLKSFIEGDAKPTKTKPIALHQSKLINQLQKAQVEQTTLHVIYGKRHFTGDLLKYDKDHQKIILKNRQHNLSVIISLDEIDKISPVPKTICDAQKQGS